MPSWPLLDIRAALTDADRNLEDIVYYVRVLQADTEGHYPPDAETLWANVAVIRELLTEVVPPALQHAIEAEQADYDLEEARWEPTGYERPEGRCDAPPPTEKDASHAHPSTPFPYQGHQC